MVFYPFPSPGVPKLDTPEVVSRREYCPEFKNYKTFEEAWALNFIPIRYAFEKTLCEYE
jgi:hypothetical protein